MEKDKYYDSSVSILEIANDFYEAYQRCKRGEKYRIDEYGRQVWSVPDVPVLVNGAFACELYLKGLLHTDKHGHELNNFFILLDDNTKADIKNYCDEHCSFWQYNFEEALKQFSDTFEYWRYIHEKKDFGELGLNKSLMFLDAFIEILKDIANKHIEQ